MTAFTAKVASLLDAGKKIRTDWLNALWDNTTYAKERLDTHIHNGTDSALIEIGPNLLRNGSFENSSDGWTLTPYTGGTTAVGSTGAMHGVACLALTSTVLANGGGYATWDEYKPVAPGREYFASQIVAASVGNVSSKLEILWYNSAKSQIGASTYSTTNTPTTATVVGVADVAPAGAAYARVRTTGGVPSSGSATGTVYVDRVIFNERGLLQPAIAAGNVRNSGGGGTDNSGSYVELVNFRVAQSGWYRTSFTLAGSSPYVYGKIYKNGSALGTERSAGSAPTTFTEDFYFDAGDTVQVFGKGAAFNDVVISNAWLGVAEADSVIAWPLGIVIGAR